MRRVFILILTLALVAGFALAAAAEETKRDLTPEQWKEFKAAFLAKQPTDAMKEWHKGDRYPGCWVCYSMPSCNSGYNQTGYTEMVDYVVTDAWGKDSPGPDGYTRLYSKTIVENAVTVHDHIRAAVCDPR